jgi:hypothetical protein
LKCIRSYDGKKRANRTQDETEETSKEVEKAGSEN